mgnify:CR=1 FL=1
MSQSLDHPVVIAHYSITLPIKQSFDKMVPAQQRSLIIRTLMARHLVRGKAWAEVRKEFSFQKESELASRSIEERALIFYKIEMLTRKLSKEVGEKVK